MPTQTFFNLPDEKRKKILESAKKEFEQNTFFEASINKIIKEAGISRGSFYMYFENKEDLFLYMMDEFRTLMAHSIIRENNGMKMDIFDMSLAIFDHITNRKLNGAGDFMTKTLRTIDANLLGHFANIDNKKKNFKLIKKYIDIDNLKLEDEEDLNYICQLLMSTIAIEVLFVCSGKDDFLYARKRIEKKFKIIKHGILK